MKKYSSLLVSLGIPERSAEVYFCLLEQGDQSIAELCLSTDSHRMEIYRQLPLLIESWLVLERLKWKRKFYSAASPQVIRDLYNEKQEDNESHIEKLMEQYSYRDKKPRVIYQEWKKWISYVFADIVNSLSKWDVFYRISSERDTSIANSYLPKDYRKKRDKKQLERYVITSESGAKKKAPRLERELITIPKDLDEFEDNISLTLYGNKIAYIDFTTNTSIIIEQKELADFHKKMFRIMYMSLRK